MIVPPLDLPPPPGLDNIPKLPDAPVPMPVDPPAKGGIDVPAKAPVIPASTNKETGPQLPSLNLPGLPSGESVRPELPSVPPMPANDKK